MSLSRKPKPFSAAVTIALRPFPSSKRRRFARKKSRISDLSLPSAVPLGAGCSWSLESSTLSLYLSLCPSLSLSVSLSWIANDEARIDKGPAALGRLTASEAATWNPTARDRKPIVSAALAGQSSEKPRPACLQRRSRKTGTSGCSHYACLPRPARPCRYQDTAETYSGLSAFIIDTPDVLRHFYRRAARIDFQIYGRRARLGRDECPVALPRIPRRNLKGYQVFHDRGKRKVSFVDFLRRYSHVSIDFQSFEKIRGTFDST